MNLAVKNKKVIICSIIGIITLFVGSCSSPEKNRIKQQIVWIDEDKILLGNETIEQYIAFYKRAMACEYLEELPKKTNAINKQWWRISDSLNHISDSLRNIHGSSIFTDLYWNKYEQLTKEINGMQSNLLGRMMGTNLYAKYEVKKIIDSIYPAYVRDIDDLIAKRQNYIKKLKLMRSYYKPYLSSPDKTLKRLRETAITNDIEKYAECLYIIDILREQGYAYERIPIIQDSLALWLKKSEFKNLRESLEKSMMIFKQYDFVIINERTVDDTIKELLIRTIPNSSTSAFEQNTSKYYFTKNSGEWRFNFIFIPVTMGIKVVNKISVTDLYPILLFRDLDSDGLLEILKGVTKRKPNSHIDEILYEYNVMKYDTLKKYFYDWRLYPACSDTEYMNYEHYSYTEILDIRDFMSLAGYEDDEEKFASYIPFKYNLYDIKYFDIDMDRDTDVILNIGQTHYEKSLDPWISDNMIIFLENKSGQYNEWSVDTFNKVSHPGTIEIEDIDEDGKPEILCWGFSKFHYPYEKKPRSIYLNIYRYAEINGDKKK
jgi:hypothetical protein